MNSPIVMIGYTRKETLRRSLLNLSQCYGVRDHDIYLFLDAECKPEHKSAVEAMYTCANQVRMSCLTHLTIIRRERNYGVPGNLLSAVSQILDKYGRIIFFEDDVLVSRTFLKYMDSALDFYEGDARVWCINGNSAPYVKIPSDYPHDVYLTPRNLPWGWATWKNRWEKVDFRIRDWPVLKGDPRFVEKVAETGEEMLGLLDGVYQGFVRTWDVQCTYYMIKNGLFAIEPRYRLTKNIGFASVGAVNCCGRNMALECMKYYDFIPRLEAGVTKDSRIWNSFRNAWTNNSMLSRVIRKLHRVLLACGSRHDRPIQIQSGRCAS